MARQVVERLIDDLDGSDAAESVLFGLDGNSYEIDLSEKNAAALRKSLEKYISSARRLRGGTSIGRGRGHRTSRASDGRDYDIAQLREWAGTNKVKIPSRGRIPQAVVEQYKAAGGR